MRAGSQQLKKDMYVYIGHVSMYINKEVEEQIWWSEPLLVRALPHEPQHFQAAAAVDSPARLAAAIGSVG